MVHSQALQSDHSISALSIVIDKSPVGLLLLDSNRIMLANPAAIQSLALPANAVGTALHIEGPDGALMERIAEAGTTSFDYRIPASDERGEHTVLIGVVALPEMNRLLVRVDDVTAARRIEARWGESVAHAFHELKTPLAGLSLGLSNLSTYYGRLSDEERVMTIDELAEQVREMSDIMAELFQQMRSAKADRN